MSRWSNQVAEKFGLRLPRDLAAWLDDEIWRVEGGAEFCRPLSPYDMMNPSEEALWAGFMLPDTIPLIGNEYGDWLCLRVDPQGAVDEIIYWCHGGGDWIPYGKTLAEALIYDLAFRFIYPRRPEFTHPELPAESMVRSAQWAHQWLSESQRRIAPFWLEDPDVSLILDELTAHQVAEVAARRDVILRHLNNWLKSQATAKIAAELNTPWEPDFVSWLFDTKLLPDTRLSEIAERFESDGSYRQQDWVAAEALALDVIRIRQDLGWAFDIAGWAAERDGRIDVAVQRYLQGAQASLFADDTVNFRTHWYPDGYGKFSAARLAQLKDHLSESEFQDPYLNIFWCNEPSTMRSRIRDYWLEQARSAEQNDQPAKAYECYFRAGWDVGLDSMDSYASILQSLVRCSDQASWPARAAIAQVHLDSLDS